MSKRDFYEVLGVAKDASAEDIKAACGNEYLELVADIGITRIEAGEGFTDMPLPPRQVVTRAHERGLQVQFELGKKHEGAFTDDIVTGLIEQGKRWLDAGAVQLVVEARESAKDIGLFDADGNFNPRYADRFAGAFGHQICIFEAPNKPSQFALLNHFGREVHLCNVRLEELLRAEIYRRGLHSDISSGQICLCITDNRISIENNRRRLA